MEPRKGEVDGKRVGEEEEEESRRRQQQPGATALQRGVSRAQVDWCCEPAKQRAGDRDQGRGRRGKVELSRERGGREEESNGE